MSAKTTKTLLLALLLLSTSSAWSEWLKVADTAENIFYLSPKTIRNDGDMRRIWSLIDYKKRDEEGALSARVRSEFDCKGERARTLAFTTHREPMAGGAPIIKSEVASDWTSIAPLTVNETVLKLLCAR